MSTNGQTTDTRKFEIENAGYRADFWFADAGVSGKVCAEQRPQFKRLLTQIRDGETLVVIKLDRLRRDAADVALTIKALTSRKIEVVLQFGKIDLGSAADKLMLTMLSALAEMEVDLLVERTQAGLARAKAQGKVLGRPSKTTVQQRAKIIAKHQIGVTVSELARQYKISRANILGITKAQGRNLLPERGRGLRSA